MGRKPRAHVVIAEYDDEERNAYYKRFYHERLNQSDVHMIDKVINKPVSLQYLIDKVGIDKLIQIYSERATNDLLNIKKKNEFNLELLNLIQERKEKGYRKYSVKTEMTQLKNIIRKRQREQLGDSDSTTSCRD